MCVLSQCVCIQVDASLWVCGREARECGQPVDRATPGRDDLFKPLARSTGCPHVSARAGPQGCGLVHISIGWRRRGSKHIGSGHTRQIATVDHAEMRGLVTDLTSLRRGAGLSLRSGIGARDARWGILPNAAGIALTRVLHTGRVCPESMCLFLFPVLSCPINPGAIGTGEPLPQPSCGARRGISWRTMSQMKPASSRAIATHTSLVFFPARVRVR